MSSPSDRRALLRLEKKVDVLMDKVNRLLALAVKEDSFILEVPMSQPQQTCPLCRQLVDYFIVEGGVDRRCGCTAPIGG